MVLSLTVLLFSNLLSDFTLSSSVTTSVMSSSISSAESFLVSEILLIEVGGGHAGAEGARGGGGDGVKQIFFSSLALDAVKAGEKAMFEAAADGGDVVAGGCGGE